MLPNARFVAVSLAVAMAANGCSLVRGHPPSAPTPLQSLATKPTASPSPTQVPVLGHLGEALAYVPPVTTSVSFTDWAALKGGAGAPRLTGASSFAAKADALRSEATAAGYGLRFLAAHHDDWGFDAFDLEWDLLIIGVSGPPVWVLRFTEGFDLGPLKRHLKQRGFETEPSSGGELYTHTLDADAEWTSSTELAILNTAFLADGHTLILSPDNAPTSEMLVRGPVDGMSETARRVAGLLGTPAALMMLIGRDTCSDLAAGLPTTSDELRASLDRQLAAAGPFRAYDVLAVSYSRAEQVIGRIVIGYGSPAVAAADFAGRATLARSGTSARSGHPYADTVFALATARQQAGAIVFEVAPHDDEPARLFQMVDDRDMLFALCTPTT